MSRKEVLERYYRTHRTEAIARTAVYLKTPKGKASQQRYRNKPMTKLRIKARNLINREITAGRIIRGVCEVCGAPHANAHHTDYAKPYDVTWLCPTHHREAHNV